MYTYSCTIRQSSRSCGGSWSNLHRCWILMAALTLGVPGARVAFGQEEETATAPDPGGEGAASEPGPETRAATPEEPADDEAAGSESEEAAPEDGEELEVAEGPDGDEPQEVESEGEEAERAEETDEDTREEELESRVGDQMEGEQESGDSEERQNAEGDREGNLGSEGEAEPSSAKRDPSAGAEPEGALSDPQQGFGKQPEPLSEEWASKGLEGSTREMAVSPEPAPKKLPGSDAFKADAATQDRPSMLRRAVDWVVDGTVGRVMIKPTMEEVAATMDVIAAAGTPRATGSPGDLVKDTRTAHELTEALKTRFEGSTLRALAALTQVRDELRGMDDRTKDPGLDQALSIVDKRLQGELWTQVHPAAGLIPTILNLPYQAYKAADGAWKQHTGDYSGGEASDPSLAQAIAPGVGLIAASARNPGVQTVVGLGIIPQAQNVYGLFSQVRKATGY